MTTCCNQCGFISGEHTSLSIAFRCFPAWRLLQRGAKWRLLTGALLEICGRSLAPVKPVVHLKGYRVSQPTWGFTMIYLWFIANL